jgi:non-specific serine/threonine protein kinase
MLLSAGQRLGPYEIVGPIGSGGMGDVYEALDTRLRRRVAIKTLRPELLANPSARRRFEREARAISSLNHPNICTVFDVGHEDGLDFLVLEYIEGRTLAALLRQETLAEATLVKYGAQIADAVAEAHDHGVLHRDIKPQNVIVTPRGQVKVLDFGLAKDLETSPDAVTLSDGDSGGVMGTAAYMSPEQIRGETLDARSDAFSFGGLLYEALSGHPPFQAATVPATLSAILTTEPVPLARVAPQTSAELQRIVRKCLEKDKSRRYQTLRDISTDLENLSRPSGDAAPTVAPPGEPPALRRPWRWFVIATVTALLLVTAAAARGWWRSSTVPAIKSMAILPLKPLAAGGDENYLGLGIADAVIGRISGTQTLSVRPISAVRRYASDDADALEAGRALLVDAVLDGSWQRDAERFRVTVNLLRVADGASLWTESFDLPATDVFAMQDRVSAELAARLRLEVDARRATDPAGGSGGTRNPEAYEAYLRGIFYLGVRGYGPMNRGNTDKAIAYLERAVAMDTNFAEAHAKLGFAYAHTAIFAEENAALIQRAKRETQLAADLRPELAQVHLNRGMILWTWYEGWRIVDSIREYRSAARLDPSFVDAELAAAYCHLGMTEDWRRIWSRLLEQDPTNRQIAAVFVNEHFYMNLPEEGAAVQKRLLNEAPDGRYFLARQRVEEASPFVEANVRESPENPYSYANLALLRALQRRAREAEENVALGLQRFRWKNRNYHHFTYQLARVYAQLGNAPEAARWLEETVAWGYPGHPIFSTDSFLDPVRESTPVRTILSNVKAQWEQYQAALR